MIQMDPEVKKVFEKSIAVSSKYNYISKYLIFIFYTAQKGRSANLLKEGSKRKRTKQQI